MLNISKKSDFYSFEKANSILSELLKLDYKDIKLNIYGRKFTPKRKCIAFGDSNLSYHFSGTTMLAEPWTEITNQIKDDLKKEIGVEFNYCLVNYYPDGSSGIGLHKDNEIDLDENSPIACVSFGASRDIRFYKDGTFIKKIPSTHGSLYIMYPPTNQLYAHKIPPQPKVCSPRISLTFRNIKLNKCCAYEFTGENSPKSRKRKSNLNKDSKKYKMEDTSGQYEQPVVIDSNLQESQSSKNESDEIPTKDWLDLYLREENPLFV